MRRPVGILFERSRERESRRAWSNGSECAHHGQGSSKDMLRIQSGVNVVALRSTVGRNSQEDHNIGATYGFAELLGQTKADRVTSSPRSTYLRSKRKRSASQTCRDAGSFRSHVWRVLWKFRIQASKPKSVRTFGGDRENKHASSHPAALGGKADTFLQSRASSPSWCSSARASSSTATPSLVRRSRCSLWGYRKAKERVPCA